MNKTLINLAISLSILGLGISIYLSLYKLDIVPMGCTVSSCSEVANSQYAYILGVPIAYLGVVFYAVNMALPLFKRYSEALLWAIFGVLFSIYFTYLEAFVIKAWCEWCVISAWITVCLLLLNLRILKSSRSQIAKINDK